MIDLEGLEANQNLLGKIGMKLAIGTSIGLKLAFDTTIKDVIIVSHFNLDMPRSTSICLSVSLSKFSPLLG